AMTALWRSGRAASALALYGAVRTRLRDDLGLSPSRETEALHDMILLADVPAAMPAVLPGRAAELQALEDAVQRGGLIAVEGEAGSGKSRLVATWAEATDRRVLTIQCDELGRVLPLQPVVDAVAALGAEVSTLGELHP